MALSKSDAPMLWNLSYTPIPVESHQHCVGFKIVLCGAPNCQSEEQPVHIQPSFIGALLESDIQS